MIDGSPENKKGANASIPSHTHNPERPPPPALAGQLATSNSVAYVPQASPLVAHPALMPGPGEVSIDGFGLLAIRRERMPKSN